MEMEIVMPVPPVDFNFDSTCSSPYMTAPSSPQRFGNLLFSAPTSPTRMSSFYRELNDITLSTNSSSTIPFDWEKKPGTPKSKNQSEDNNKNDGDLDDYNEDFEFDFSGQLERTSLSAEELFDGGKIKPLKPPPGYDSSVSSPRSPRSPRSRATKKKEFDPFQAAIEETCRGEVKLQINQQGQAPHQRGRGRSCGSGSSFSGSIRKGSRSLSPLRVSDITFHQEENSQNSNNISSTASTPKSSYTSSILSAISFTSKRYKKWKLKDLLLFRSASEGSRTTSCNDPLTKYSVLSKKEVAEDVKNSSFRSTDSIGSSRRRSGPISAHEVHYTVNRAVSEEMKRKTFLPYKQGLLGCLGFNRAASVHEISRGVRSLTRG
ncbi:hypothetical protein POPTR_009G105400v4 [Populus trichocarpa]|jgi:hypothetical protein|uniref:Uncharacterized protein n=1 Tax=Populus trichocarpa TaxID=3694 RepID=B9HRX7_POPTR|nr:uncharacterized protein LOC7490015 [Populus trichocarpa]PNT20663.1 hypothetical protein POPTR_009G105400v4 [Populus trichocarpa]|eukprot:XP_002313839.2 uncharacterized protein LOC7490015 [Populus trichocarpa]